MISKKAQATTFVVLGIILISLTVVVVYFRESIFSGIGKEALQEQPTIAEIENVRSFTQDCIETTLSTGTQIIGMQGGYISLPDDDFPISPYNVLSNYVDIFGNGNLRVPYWSYLTPNNIERIQVPTKQSMEKELADYIESETLNCLNDYQLFNTQGYDVSYSAPEVKVEIGQEAVLTNVKMALNVVYKDAAQRFEDFRAESKVPLGKLHASALEIFDYESQTTFIENFTLDMMAMYDEVPFSGVDLECSPRAWLKSKVIKDLKSIFALNIPTIKIKGTDFSLRNKKDELLIFDALKNPEKDMTVSLFFSKEWPIMIDVIGENSELIRGKPFTAENEASKFLLPLFCMNDNHFVYDLKYPVIITLTQDGYTFQYGIMSVIDNNQPKKNIVEVPQFEGAQEICSRADTTAKVIASGIASDGSAIPMKDVDISLTCTFTECPLGRTREETSGYSLTTIVPQCVGGQLRANKQGYHESVITVDTNEPGNFFVNIEPYYEFSVSVIVRDNGQFRAPYPTETIYFQFENPDSKYYTSYYYPSGDKLKLIAGNYKIASTLLVQMPEGFELQAQEIEVCSNVPSQGIGGIFGMKEKKCTKQKLDPMKLDNVISGGGSYSWNIERKILSTANKIVLYVNRVSTPQTLTDLNKLYQNQEEFSKSVTKPTFE